MMWELIVIIIIITRRVEKDTDMIHERCKDVWWIIWRLILRLGFSFHFPFFSLLLYDFQEDIVKRWTTNCCCIMKERKRIFFWGKCCFLPWRKRGTIIKSHQHLRNKDSNTFVTNTIYNNNNNNFRHKNFIQIYFGIENWTNRKDCMNFTKLNFQ